VYLADPAASTEPPKQLKAFQKVLLQPGESRQVSLTLDPRALAYWDTGSHGWKVAAGKYAILVGSSSRDIRLQGAVGLPAKSLGS
jgi:beta-glucosidase